MRPDQKKEVSYGKKNEEVCCSDSEYQIAWWKNIYAVEATTQKAAINKVRRKWGPLSVLYVEER